MHAKHEYVEKCPLKIPDIHAHQNPAICMTIFYSLIVISVDVLDYGLKNIPKNSDSVIRGGLEY